MNSDEFIENLNKIKDEIIDNIDKSEKKPEILRMSILGPKSQFGLFIKNLQSFSATDKKQLGKDINRIKKDIKEKLTEYALKYSGKAKNHDKYFDPTEPGIKPPIGHLHIVTYAISEITNIFEKIGFVRVRHPEVEWDYYAFESLNMPEGHPARDEWETFFINFPGQKVNNPKKQNIVLTPHTSNGQVREMEKGNLPIRMINIAKCYRRQSDISHTPMFHQFEGLYIDKNVSITHLKGVFDYFAKQYYGKDRKIRLRPSHFQFTEPSFEVDITCDICKGSGCRLCKEGWLELAGAGMVHPKVLEFGNIDTKIYNGFAFGWGIERAAMMKSGTKIPDIRILYGNDIRFLEQF